MMVISINSFTRVYGRRGEHMFKQLLLEADIHLLSKWYTDVSKSETYSNHEFSGMESIYTVVKVDGATGKRWLSKGL